MKKTASKSTVAKKIGSTAPKVATTTKAASLSAKTLKAAVVPKPVKAVKASAPAPKRKAPKAASGRSSKVVTTIVAAVDVGYGNRLMLRGQGAGLSWDEGLPMKCSADNRWEVILPETSQAIVCKFLLNDEQWCVGDDYTILPGSTVVLSPGF